MDVKNCQYYCKRQIHKNFHGLYAYQLQQWRQNVQNFAMKPLACGSWFHLSFEHFDVISMVDKSADNEKLQFFRDDDDDEDSQW